jgi:steroid delta-isomerase-like uncharacterized protein
LLKEDKMRSKLAFTAVFFLVFCVSAYGIEVSMPQLSAQPGDMITVEISVDDATGIAGGDITLTYDPAILEAKEVRPTDLAAGLTVLSNIEVAGAVTVSMLSVTLEGLAGGSGALIEVDFEAIAAGESPLILLEASFSDEIAADIPTTAVDGGVTVAAAPVEPPVEPALAIQLSVPELSAQVGDTITVEISVDDATGIAGGDITLTYDPAILEAKEVRATDLAATLTVLSNIEVAGQVTVSMMSATLEGLAGGAGALLEVDFEAIAVGESPLTLSEASFSDETAADIPTTAVDGSVTVAEPVEEPTEEEANKAIERRVFEEIWNQGALDVADEVFASDAVLHGLTAEDMSGPEAFKQFVVMYRAAFPDMEWAVEDQIAEGDMVVTRLTGTGTHQGELMGIPPTNVQATTTVIAIVRITDGKIQESWNSVDMLGLMQQLGVITPGRESYTWGDPSEVTGDPGTPEGNTAICDRSVDEFWNTHNIDAADGLFSADYVAHVPPTPGHPLVGLEALKQFAVMQFTAFPDFHTTVHDTIAEGDKVAKRWTVTGTHLGEFMGMPPSGNSVTFSGITISRFADGMLVEGWWAWDALGMMQQITAPPSVPEELVVDQITSPSLDGNLLGDPATRDMVIYLPPEYDTSGRSYPVLYLMPGLGAGSCWWACADYSEFFTLAGVALPTDFPEAGFASMIDGLIAAGEIQPMIIVMPDISTAYGGSFCVNSELNGNYEDYIINDIVPYIDANYRTLPSPDSRGIVGHCMGGYSAMYLTMRHPDVFGAVASHSGMLSITGTLAGSLELIAAENPEGLTVTGPDPTKPWTTSLYTLSAAWSPNASNPPFFVDLPVDENVQTREDVVQRWAAHDPMLMIADHIPDLAGLRGIYLDGGDKDELGLGLVAQMFSEALSAAGVDNQFEMFDGTHMDKMYTRLAMSLSYLSDVLVGEELEKPKDYSNVFFMSLAQGLNMISLPLEPVEAYTARSFATEIGATVVIRYDVALKEFDGFALNAPGDGFAIEGGKGYIVNTPVGGVVAFTGAAWTNEPPIEPPPPPAAPPAPSDSAWAFVVSGSVLDGDEISIGDSCYTVSVKNLRTGATATKTASTSGYFAAVWADLNRNAVIEAGDRVEVAVIDSSGGVASGPYVYDITLDEIRNAVLDVRLRLGDIIPAKSALLQNYPNPFNPETWIPFHLSDEAPVSIRIYSPIGQLIRTLDLGHRDAGVYVSRSTAAYWDGKNEAGEAVASGIYFYSIAAGDFSATRKMVITK